MPPNQVSALLVILGTACGVMGPWLSGHECAAALASASCAVLTRHRRGRALLAAGAVIAASAALGTRARERAEVPPLQLWLSVEQLSDTAGLPVDVEGTLVEDASPVEDGTRLLIDVDRVRGRAGWRQIDGRVQAYVAGAFGHARLHDWTGGRPVRAPMRLKAPPVWLNPGGPSLRWQALTRRADLTGTVKSSLLVQVAPASWWDEAGARVRAHVRRRVARQFAAYPPQVGAIVTAVLIGDRAGLDEPLEARLQQAGTYHVLAISGGNIALLSVGLYGVVRLFTRSFRLRALITLVVVLVYGRIVGGDPSVTRAITAAAIYLSCGLVGLAPTALDVLAVVALAVVLSDPLAVVSAGAWLTFGATLGIVLVSKRARRRPARSPAAWHERARGLLLDLWLATLAAELALLPVAASVFSRVSAAGLLLNVIAVPMMTVVQLCGGVAVAVGAWWATAASLTTTVAAWAALAITESARVVEVLPWLTWRVPPPPVAVVLLFYTAGGCWLVRWGVPWRRRTAIGMLGVVAVAIASSPQTSCARPSSDWVRLTMFDVGQGDGVLLQAPGRYSLLVDAGARARNFDLGERVVTPGVWASGERRLRALAFSHADLDHIGGALAVAAEFRPGEIWEGVPVPSDPKRQALQDFAHGTGIPWRVLQQGDRLGIGEVSLDVLSPPRPDWERQHVRNNDAIVLRVRYRDVEMLLTGDVDADVERQLDVNTSIPVRILKVGHHGSRSSTSDDLIRRFAPHLALVSAGRGNTFGHPASDVLRRLERAGARVFRTDLDGAVIVETDGREVRVRSMTGRTWMTRVWRTRA